MGLEPKKISWNTYLVALALFTIARSSMEKTDEFVAQMEETLGVPKNERRSSHFSDEVFSGGAVSLDAALDRAGYLVEKPQAPEPPQPDGWRPIKDAPTDGTSVIVSSGRAAGEAWHNAEDEKWYWANTHPTDATQSEVDPFPQWWMPLPAPKTQEA